MLDIAIRGGWILDGTGSPAFRGDVGIQDQRIASIGDVARAERDIDAAGMFVAPGFVDMHAHSDLQLLADPAAPAKVMQGVVTEVLGQDGLSFAPADRATLDAVRTQTAAWNGDPEGLDYDWSGVSDYLARFERARPSVNVAY